MVRTGETIKETFHFPARGQAFSLFQREEIDPERRIVRYFKERERAPPGFGRTHKRVRSERSALRRCRRSPET
jgi:hypothetical protein